MEYMRLKLLGTLQALEFCRSNGARFVFLSSYMYGEMELLLIPESAALAARNQYALSNMLAEEVCKFYAVKFGVKVTVLRPFNVYGAGQSHRILVPLIINQARAGGTIRVIDLAPKRDYIYIKDLVDAISSAISLNSSYDVFNIGTGISYSVGELIATIQGIFGSSLPVVCTNERRSGEIMDTVADIATARRDLRCVHRFSLQDGLKDMLCCP